MTRWTEEQERAIALSDRRLLISAAAGSGKTAVLTERIVARVLDPKHPVDIDELLIMTFTRAAAAEMRERIRRRLEDCLQQALRDGESGIAARAKRELAELDAARITTIDSFCLTVLREHADRLAVDPAFRVGSEEELRILQNDVLEELLEEQYEKADPAFLRFADAFSQGKADLGIGLRRVCPGRRSGFCASKRKQSGRTAMYRRVPISVTWRKSFGSSAPNSAALRRRHSFSVKREA